MNVGFEAFGGAGQSRFFQSKTEVLQELTGLARNDLGCVCSVAARVRPKRQRCRAKAVGTGTALVVEVRARPLRPRATPMAKVPWGGGGNAAWVEDGEGLILQPRVFGELVSTYDEDEQPPKSSVTQSMKKRRQGG